MGVVENSKDAESVYPGKTKLTGRNQMLHLLRGAHARTRSKAQDDLRRPTATPKSS